jgi:hypothetical protein
MNALLLLLLKWRCKGTSTTLRTTATNGLRMNTTTTTYGLTNDGVFAAAVA